MKGTFATRCELLFFFALITLWLHPKSHLKGERLVSINPFENLLARRCLWQRRSTMLLVLESSGNLVSRLLILMSWSGLRSGCNTCVSIFVCRFICFRFSLDVPLTVLTIATWWCERSTCPDYFPPTPPLSFSSVKGRADVVVGCRTIRQPGPS